MNQCHFYTSCKSDKIIVLLQTEFNFHHYNPLPWDIILNETTLQNKTALKRKHQLLFKGAGNSTLP
jgi:hypothetical protein